MVSIFFILHAFYLIRIVFLGIEPKQFFIFEISYLHDAETALISLLYVLLCVTCLVLGYYLYPQGKVRKRQFIYISKQKLQVAAFVTIIGLTLSLLLNIYAVYVGEFNYSKIIAFVNEYNFYFELRIIPLLFFSYMLFNNPEFPGVFFKKSPILFLVSFAYIVSLLFLQIRSRIFEFAIVLIFSYLVKTGNKIRKKYLLILVGSVFLPNIFLLTRLDLELTYSELISSLFSFEYAFLFNNILGTVITQGWSGENLTFFETSVTIIPSPIRAWLGIEVVKSEYYQDVASESGAMGGGFSLLAELFTNFGWFAPLFFLGLGWVLRKFVARTSNAGGVSILASTAPLFYSAFVLAFRNDLGVFIKYSLQIFILAALCQLAYSVMRRRKNRVNVPRAPV